MYDKNHEEEGEGHAYWSMHKPMKKEFKLALIEKKEKMLKVELEFVEKMKELIKKMPETKKQFDHKNYKGRQPKVAVLCNFIWLESISNSAKMTS